VVDDAIEVGNYADAPGRGALGQILQDNLSRARGQVMIDLGTKYRGIDGMFKQLTSTEGKSGAELLQAQTLDRVIRNTIVKNVDDSLAQINQTI
jgi:hypothetical protein